MGEYEPGTAVPLARSEDLVAGVWHDSIKLLSLVVAIPLISAGIVSKKAEDIDAVLCLVCCPGGICGERMQHRQ